MKKLLFALLALITIDLLFQQCANPRSPTGGPRDSIPPTLVEMYPLNGTTGFKDQEIRLEFSEYISADQLKQKLIITPKTNINYKSIVKRNQLIIKFEEPFKDSTTYNLNFADGVVDITEKNPAVNLSLAFSTGSFIDSMSISGNIIDLFSQQAVGGYTVGLYPFSDSLDYFVQSPMYFATTNDSGRFQLNYLKTGNYKLVAFDDDNKNILLDPETESHGFLSGQINLDSATSIAKSIPSVLQNIKPITLISGRPTGLYFEAKYNKTIDDYSLNPPGIYHSVVGDKKDVIRIYKPLELAYRDSIPVYINARDSLQNTAVDTLYIQYIESNRKPNPLSLTVSTIGDEFQNNQEFLITFNKPIASYDSTNYSYEKDSTFSFSFEPILDWNHNKTQLKVSTDVNRDTLLAALERSLPVDSAQTQDEENQIPSIQRSTAQPQSIDMVIEAGSFISIEGDTTARTTQNISLAQSNSFGTIKFQLSTSYKSFILQLLNKQDQVLYQRKNELQFTFPRVKPGNYKIRVLIDNDLDGKWSAGNLLLDIEPEDIYLHPEETSVRENWVLDIPISF